MKVALLYSGQPRYVKECHSNHIKTFYRKNPDSEIDVFAHIWYDEKLVGSYFRNEVMKNGKWEPDTREYIMNAWKPKGIIFEDLKNSSHPGALYLIQDSLL